MSCAVMTIAGFDNSIFPFIVDNPDSDEAADIELQIVLLV